LANQRCFNFASGHAGPLIRFLDPQFRDATEIPNLNLDSEYLGIQFICATYYLVPQPNKSTMSPLESFSKWLKLKIYQLEVTFSVYIFTPAEKFFFCKLYLTFVSSLSHIFHRTNLLLCGIAGSVVFLLFSLTFLATVLYLPQHISFILGRAWFYMNGETVDVGALAKEVVHSATATAMATADAARKTVREL
jgi:hypothetical protein